MTITNARRTGPALALGAVAGALAFGAGPAQAELFGLMNGRSAAPPEWNTAVEAALQLGNDTRTIGIRGNYALSDTLTAFANLGQLDFDDSPLDGVQIGGGVFYHLTEQSLAPSLDIALKPSIGYARLTAGSLDADLLSIGAEVLLSGTEPLTANGLNWYANAGLAYAYFDTDSSGADFDDDEFDPIVGGGIHLPVGPGTVYAGVDYIDEVQIGGGFRYALR